jgi:branched-chain amino acid transport system permease protein
MTPDSDLAARFQRVDRRRGQLCALVVAIAVPFAVAVLPDYWVQLCITAAIDAIVLQSIGILADRTNLFVLCPLAFAGIGGWVILQVFVWGWPGNFYLWTLLAGLAAVPFGLLMGLPSLRLRGIYLAVITLSFAFALDSIFQVVPFPGTQSLKALNRPTFIAGDKAYFTFCWAAFVLFAIVLYVLDRRPFGAAWRIIARSERATAAMGLSVRQAKLVVFVISAFIAGISGALLVGQVSTAVEANFSPVQSLVLFSVALLVGAGYPEGAVVGGILSSFAPQVLRSIHVPQDFGNIVFPLGVIQVLSVGMTASGAWRATARRTLRRRRGARAGEVRPAGVQAPVAQAAAGQAAVPETSGAHETAASPVGALPVTAGTRPEGHEPSTALRVRDLTVRFGSVTALDGVSLAVPAATVCGLIGPNGAGKSTLVDSVSGFIREYTGTIEIAGRAVDGLVAHQRVRAGVRRTFQQERTIPEFSAEQYVRVAARRRISAQEAADVLDFIGGPAPQARVADIDVGARRLLEVAGCLAARPAVLLLDEPTAGLAEAESLAFAARVAMAPAVYGCAVLLIEHDMEVVRAACTHVTVLDFGAVIAEGAPDAVLQMDAVVAAYLGDPDDPALTARRTT